MDSELDCEACDDTGTMIWLQPAPSSDGGFALIQVSHPCTCARSTWQKHPAAERSGLVDQFSDMPVGNVARANARHRTDWSQSGRLPPRRP